VHTWPNGDKYEGEWKANLRHGSGSDFFHNGDTYVGQYEHGMQEGQGQYKWANGTIYVGSFSQGLKHGKGKWKKVSATKGRQTTFDGEYFQDKKQGEGRFEWESGNVYEGSFLQDDRHGFG
jgi:hypothetical protein